MPEYFCAAIRYLRCSGIDTPLPLTLWRVITRTIWGNLLFHFQLI